MDNQIRNLCEVCNKNVSMGVGPTKKWMCGECLIKFDAFIKEEKKKQFEIFEKTVWVNDGDIEVNLLEEEKKDGNTS